MFENPVPTRAEVNDVANSIMDGADAVMLSGETSVGKFPIKVIQKMTEIIGSVEFSDLIIKPKKGTLIIFPPLWMFPHKGNPPINESKYLLSTYLHYT